MGVSAELLVGLLSQKRETNKILKQRSKEEAESREEERETRLTENRSEERVREARSS